MLGNLMTILIGVVVIVFVGVVLAFILTSRFSKKKASAEAQVETTELEDSIESSDMEEISSDPSYLQLVMDDDQVYHLELPATLGRSASNTFEINDDSVSSQHAIIRFDTRVGAICIEDLNSLNGIFVDGRPTIKNVLVDGARLTIGGVSFTFRDTGYLPPIR